MNTEHGLHQRPRSSIKQIEMDSGDGRVIRFEDDIDMGTCDVCALDNTMEHEDETQNLRSINTDELIRIPMAKLASPNLLQQLKEIDSMMSDEINRCDAAPEPGEPESPKQQDVGVRTVHRAGSQGRVTVVIEAGAAVSAMPEETLPNVPHSERAENEFCRATDGTKT